MHKTKKVAVSIVAALVLALAAPAFAQPFADVPTDHWAFDAIAELAAKGLIEGYPDGTFRGDRNLTRYEMAMIVARIIARIEAIPPPPPPAPLPPAIVALPGRVTAAEGRITAAEGRITVTERDIALIRRLVAEFRAELAALGVRLTAVEEELAGLRGRLDRTRIAGHYNHLYFGVSTPALPNQAPRLGLSRIQLLYTGDVAPGITATLRVRYTAAGNPNVGTGVGGDPGVAAPGHPAGTAPGTIFFDRAFVDWTRAFDVPGLRLRLGRDVITLGPIGLLLDGAYWNARRDGARADFAIGPLSLTGFVQYSAITQHTTAFVAGGRASFAPIPGWTLGVNFRTDQDPWGMVATGTGFGGDLSGELIRGLRLTVEYAQYTLTGFPANNYLYAEAVLDLRRLAGIELLRPTLTVWYRLMDPQVFPLGSPLPDPVTPDFLGFFGGGNRETFGGRLDVELFSNLFAWALVDTGHQITPFATFTTWEVGARWVLAPRTTLFLFYADSTLGVVRTNYWGTFLSVTW